MSINRVIVIVLDSAGVGRSPDAHLFGDKGANTIGHIAEAVGGLNVPNMQTMGLGNVLDIRGVPPASVPIASYGAMIEASAGKDTMTGHWEMMGLIISNPFPVFPNGFPPEIILPFLQVSGYPRVLGNKPASGVEIIRELGEEHIRTGLPIVYTSADSVFQIAAHEAVIPPDHLWTLCEKARVICDAHQIGRVIARPFIGEAGAFSRTSNRRDFPMIPPGETVLDILKGHGLPVAGIGKIEDIFAHRGLTRAIHTENNDHGVDVLKKELEITRSGMIFVNLVDFDMVYGHRNDTPGYAAALEKFDSQLTDILPRIGDTDLLVITADHGCDPTFPGTDHTRENVPLLAYSPGLEPKDLGIRSSFADLGAAILQLFNISHSLPGVPFGLTPANPPTRDVFSRRSI